MIKKYLLLSVILFILAILVNFIFNNQTENTGHKLEKFQKAFNEKETRGIYLLSTFIEEYNGSDKSTNINSFIDLYQDEGFLFLIYKSDSLIFWSDNAVPVPNYYPPSLFESGFIFLDNGWFRSLVSRTGTLNFVELIRIKSNYPYKNEYLENNFLPGLILSSDVIIEQTPGENNVSSLEGDFLFSVVFPDNPTLPARDILILLFLYIAAFVSLIILIFNFYQALPFFNNRKYLLFISVFIDVLIIRFILFYFRIPDSLYESELFSPYYYASSWVIPSFGDLILNVIFLFITFYLIFSRITVSTKHDNNREAISIIPFIIVFAFSLLLILFIRDMVLNSSLILDINHIYEFNIYSYIAYFVMATVLFIFFMITSKLCKLALSMTGSLTKYMMFAGLSMLLLIPAIFFVPEFDVIFYLLISAYILSYALIFRRIGQVSFYSIVFLLLFFALFLNYSLNKYLQIKEKDHRELLASELASERDAFMEYGFIQLAEKIKKDEILKSLLFDAEPGAYYDDDIIAYIQDSYFSSLGKKYELLITVCDPAEILDIQPEGYLINCSLYFQNITDAYGKKTPCNDLFYLEDNSENDNYLALLTIQSDDPLHQAFKNLYIELFSRVIPEEGLGYPELLTDKEHSLTSDLSAYSYARYRNDRLTYKYGSYYYSINPGLYIAEGSTSGYIDRNGYNHYYIRVKDRNYLILSKKDLSVLDAIAPFSYLFVFFGIYILLFMAFFIMPSRIGRVNFNFSEQFQITVISIILVSFIGVGFITRDYIIRLNNQKNTDIISEKTHSVLIELEHKLADVKTWTPELEIYLNELMYKFSLVFFSDINLFDLEGHLLATSRHQIYNEGLISDKMNRLAFNALSRDHKLQFIHTETIGKHAYLSSYIPFRNNEDQIIAYLNLPYFAKQSELQKQFTGFLMAYVNIYVLVTVLAILLTIMVSRYITKPLQLLRGKLGGIKLGDVNEKIEWKKQDEIGSLVAEYNRMVDELALSADLLARSERESAWREMAKQVAHEIKNPLTPMKLSVQHLKRSWDDEMPDFSVRIDRTCKTLTEQIDALSAIASEFSDFAKMPVASVEKNDLSDIINSSVALFEDIYNIKIGLHFYPHQEYNILADRQQMMRVFNNLIKNAVQAIGKEKDGLIGISIDSVEDKYRIKISDNGPGIPEDQTARIFSPSFTTKSGGMGLGLAMVKSIIMEAGGEISFTSEKGQGTVFTILLPKYTS